MLSYSEPDPHEFNERPSEEDEVRSLIDRLMQFAATPDEWLKICQLCKSIGDEPPIERRNVGHEWHANRPDYDEGMPFGHGKTELDAIADLLEREDA